MKLPGVPLACAVLLTPQGVLHTFPFPFRWSLVRQPVGCCASLSPAQERDHGTFALPVFPLRKSVRLPTEQLTLNLYEERYLALARFVLQKPIGQQMFGALYTSNKPQIIKAGVGPIVPIIEKGDVGVLFLVSQSEEGLIPTIGTSPRLRTRLVGRGVARFQIKKILHNGFHGGEEVENNAKEVPLPFILVEAKLFDAQDLTELLHSTVEGPRDRPLIDELARKLQEVFPHRTDLDSTMSTLSTYALLSARLDETAISRRLCALRGRKPWR